MADEPNLSREAASGVSPVCGVDEGGRGPWAGPLVAGAAIIPPKFDIQGVSDSKRLSPATRERLAALLHDRAIVALGIVEVTELDRIGLTAANDLAMARAIEALPVAPAFALIDGRRVPKGLPIPAEAIIKGDGKSLSIAAASIVAKVARDRMMSELAKQHPGYGWETNAGYGTAGHRAALKTLGLTPHHRRSFKPIAEILLEEQ